MPAGRTSAAYNPADYDEFGNYIGGASESAPPPAAQDTGGTLPMADQSMYTAPVEAKYQPGGAKYFAPPPAAPNPASESYAIQQTQTQGPTPLPVPLPPTQGTGPIESFPDQRLYTKADYSGIGEPGAVLQYRPDRAMAATAPPPPATPPGGDPIFRGPPTLDWVQGARDAVQGAADRFVLPMMQDAARGALGDPGRSRGPFAVRRSSPGASRPIAPPPPRRPDRAMAASAPPMPVALPPEMPTFETGWDPWGDHPITQRGERQRERRSPSIFREGSSYSANPNQAVLPPPPSIFRPGSSYSATPNQAVLPAVDVLDQIEDYRVQELNEGTLPPTLGLDKRGTPGVIPPSRKPPRVDPAADAVGSAGSSALEGVREAVTSGSRYPGYIPGSTYVPPSQRPVGRRASGQSVTAQESGTSPLPTAIPGHQQTGRATPSSASFRGPVNRSIGVQSDPSLLAAGVTDAQGKLTSGAIAKFTKDGLMANGVWTTDAEAAGAVRPGGAGRNEAWWINVGWQGPGTASPPGEPIPSTPVAAPAAAASGGGGTTGGTRTGGGGRGGGSSFRSSGGGGYSGGGSRSSGRGFSFPEGFGSDSGEVDWRSLVRDFDGNGRIDAKDIRRAKAEAKMRRGKRGKRGTMPGFGGPNMNWSEDFEARMGRFAQDMSGLGERISGKPKDKKQR